MGFHLIKYLEPNEKKENFDIHNKENFNYIKY